VDCDRGYNVGFVDREFGALHELTNHEKDNLRSKKILNDVFEDQIIRNLLREKIAAENYALAQCKSHVKGRKLAFFSDIISAEFQFDRKKLVIYLKKYQEISVCRLVRNLYETFKIRIKVLEVEDVNVLYDLAQRYHELSKLNIPFSEIFNFDLKESIRPLFLLRPEPSAGQQTAQLPLHSGKPRQRGQQPKVAKNSTRSPYLRGDFESHRVAPSPSLVSRHDSLQHLPLAPPLLFSSGNQFQTDYNSNSNNTSSFPLGSLSSFPAAASAPFSSASASQEHERFSVTSLISPRSQSQSFPWNEPSDWSHDSGPVGGLPSPRYSYFPAAPAAASATRPSASPLAFFQSTTTSTPNESFRI
jgi:hypothetical protein